MYLFWYITRSIFLLFILVSPLKANTIYNLIRIPNLEIYEINTLNKLKYFSATKPFRLGVTKNIKCLNPDQITLENKYSSFMNALWKEKVFLTFASDYIPKNPNFKKKLISSL